MVHNNLLQTSIYESVDLSDLFCIFHIPYPVDMCFVSELGIVWERVLLPFGFKLKTG